MIGRSPSPVHKRGTLDPRLVLLRASHRELSHAVELERKHVARRGDAVSLGRRRTFPNVGPRHWTALLERRTNPRGAELFVERVGVERFQPQAASPRERQRLPPRKKWPRQPTPLQPTRNAVSNRSTAAYSNHHADERHDASHRTDEDAQASDTATPENATTTSGVIAERWPRLERPVAPPGSECVDPGLWPGAFLARHPNVPLAARRPAQVLNQMTELPQHHRNGRPPWQTRSSVIRRSVAVAIECLAFGGTFPNAGPDHRTGV
jgi:hypothetical protein